MKFQAAVAWKPCQPLEIEEIELGSLAAGEVLVKMKAAGICHTDAYTLGGKDPEGRFPCILGHEGSGVVCEIGLGVKTVSPGDHVIPLYIPECGECESCLSRKTNLCSALRQTQTQGLMPDRTSRFSCNGKSVYHYMGTSTFSEYTVVSQYSLAKIRPEVPFEPAALLGCCIPTGIGAVLNTAKVEPGSTVAVFGLGGVGLSCVQGAVMAGSERIIAVDINSKKFSMAFAMGATDCLNPNELGEQIENVIIEETNGGVDYSFECVGNVNLMRSAFECCRRGWGVATIIGVAPAGCEISTRPYQLVSGRTWKGSAFGGVKGRSELPWFADQYMAKKIRIDEYVTEILAYDCINQGFNSLGQGDGVRTVITF